MLIESPSDAIRSTYLKWEEEGRSPFLPVIESHEGNSVTTAVDRQLLMFGSCDYLGFSQDIDLKRGAIDAILRYGTNTYASQLICGHTRIHYDIESVLRRLTSHSGAIIFPSGMAASIAAVCALAGNNDTVVIDSQAHVSLFIGARTSGARVRTFSHNNMEQLETVLQQESRRRRCVVVVDGLFSATGEFAQLDAIVEIAARNDARIVVDEAHSFGSVGPSGFGVADYFGVIDKIDVLVGTMSKSLGSSGGFILTTKDTERRIRYTAPTYTSSRGVAPAVAGATLAALTLLQSKGAALRQLLSDNVKLVADSLRHAEFDIYRTQSQIIPVAIGDEDTAVDVTRWLRAKGIMAGTLVFPYVPMDAARLRIGITSKHTTGECEYLVDTLRAAKRVHRF